MGPCSRRQRWQLRPLGQVQPCLPRTALVIGSLLGLVLRNLFQPSPAFAAHGTSWSHGSRGRYVRRDGRQVLRDAASDKEEAAVEMVSEDPIELVAQSAAEAFEDTSEFFEETLKAAFKGREKELAAASSDMPSNESSLDLAEVLGNAGRERVQELQKAVSVQSESLSSFLEQASSLASPPSAFQDALSAVFRSIKDVEERVSDVVSRAATPAERDGEKEPGEEMKEFLLGGDMPDVKAQPQPSVPKSPYGLSVQDAIARTGADGGWIVPINAWIYRRNEQRHRIRMALGRKLLSEMINGLDNVSEQGARRYEERGRLIFRTLVFRGGERNVVLSVKFDGEETWRDLPITNGLGRVEVDMSVPEEVAAAAAVDGVLNFTVRLPAEKGGEGVTAQGSAVLLEPEGVLVVSDIDDTVKVTEVFLGKETVVRNTFFEEFRPVSGMVSLYRSWAQDFGAAFAFVSHSPPELQEPLRKFLLDSGFPLAPVYLRPLGGSKEERLSFKQRTISELLRQFPRRKVVLVGDSGERDPIICAELLRRHPVQVIKVLIRQVSPTSLVDEATFAGIPAHRWQVFTDPEDVTLPDQLRDLGSVPGILRYAASLGSKALREATRGASSKQDSKQVAAST